MKTSILLTTALLAVTIAVQAQDQTTPPTTATNAAPGGVREPPPFPARPRGDANSKLAHEQLVAKAKMGGIDIYFEGDSITRRWGTSDAAWAQNYANWKSNFWGWNAADFGWGADSLENILWRLQNGELDDVNPKIIVLLAGINNVGRGVPLSDSRIAYITRGEKAILDICQQKAPNAVIVMTAMFPRNDGGLAPVPGIFKINENIKAMCDGKKIRYVDVNDKLVDKDGKYLEGISRDGIHPYPKGYQIWADALKPIFTEILGPPAATDHAPPPSADPSASRGRGPAPAPPPAAPGT